MEKKRVNPQTKRAVIVIAVIIIMIGLAAALYIYARTYAKSNRLGLEMSTAAFNKILARAIPALIGMGVSACLISAMSLAFQTITESRVLTPSMIGFDSVFVGTQTLLVFMFGSLSKWFANPYINYAVTAGAMVVISMTMYGFILRKNKNNLVFLLMFGLVMSGVVRSASNYLQVIMDANEFNQLRAATSVNINNMNTDIIRLAVPVMLCVTVPMILRHRIYNVMALGPANAQSLGIDYNREVKFNLLLISVGMSISTALIGPLAFLGLLVVNISREIFGTHKHLTLFIGSAAFAALALIFGQAVVELLQGAIPVTVLIDLAGCSYMFYLILKENRI